MSKQLIFMLALTTAGTLGTFLINPFFGVVVYYLFAILRPQYVWEWVLPPDITWSFFVGTSTLAAAVMSLLGILPDLRPPAPPRPTFSRGHFAMFLFAAWIFVTYYLAQNREVAYEWFKEYAKIFLMFAASAVLLRTVKEIKYLLLMACMTIFYLSLEINVDYLQTGVIKILKHGHGGLDNNGAGLMLAMGIPLFYFLFEGMTSRWRWLLLACIPVTVHAVLMTYSRGAMLSLVLTAPLVAWRSRYRVRLLLIGGVLAAVMLPIMAGDQIRDRFLTINKAEDDGSANLRFMSWKAALRIAVDHPVFGVGVRNANLFSYEYGADMPGRTIHSQLLQIAADNGFVGLGIYMLLLLSIWREIRDARRETRGKEDPESRLVSAMAAGIEVSLGIFCIGGLFLSLEVFEFPYLLMLTAAQLGLYMRHRNSYQAPVAFPGALGWTP